VFVLVYKGPGHDFVRGFLGDVLVVQFIYLLARFVISFRYRFQLAAVVMLIGIATEILQYLSAGSIPRNIAAELTVGSTFDPLDIVAYAVGLMIVLVLDRQPKAQP